MLPESIGDLALYLENIIALMPGHIYWKDKNGVFLGCNDEQAKFIGLKSRKEVIGLTAYDTLPHDFAEQVMQADKEVMETGNPKTIEEVLTLPNGETSIWLSKKVPLRNEKNEIVGILGISFDITEKKRTEMELLEIQAKLEAMTLISASIAHELRTPLATLALGVSLLKDSLTSLLQAYQLAQAANLAIDELTPDEISSIQKKPDFLYKEISAASTFIDMLLLNLNPARDQSKIQVFSISQCIDEALSRYPFVGKQSALVKWQKDSSNDFNVRGEILLVTHVLFNLLKNAIYYVLKAGKGDIQIWLEHGTADNKLYFKDTGTGIPQDFLPHIFDRFFSKTYHGAGVGLTFCQWVMENLGGKITCESIEGDYTLFILSFCDPEKAIS